MDDKENIFIDIRLIQFDKDEKLTFIEGINNKYNTYENLEDMEQYIHSQATFCKDIYTNKINIKVIGDKRIIIKKWLINYLKINDNDIYIH